MVREGRVKIGFKSSYANKRKREPISYYTTKVTRGARPGSVFG